LPHHNPAGKKGVVGLDLIGQVPVNTKYLVIGSGRLSKHLQHYFSLLDLPFQVWTLQSNENLEQLAAAHDRICLAISDTSLAEFYTRHAFLKNKTTIHFSGSQNILGMYTAHPLMTFGPELYAREVYLNMPFITVKGEPTLRELFPEFLNPSAQIAPEKKALYHAYCVMSGNFTTLLWQNIMTDIKHDIGLDPKLLEPYLQQITANILQNKTQALTGPIARGDTSTLIRNLNALTGKAYQNIYYAFLNLVREKNAPSEGMTHEHLRF
jgi:2-dehydropantoate 2-reductase